jgi:hypothetical protein
MSVLHTNLTILDAIDHPKIFKPWFRDPESWVAWRAFLAALFALPMSPAELAAYQASTARANPPSRQAREAWLCVGRRGGKSLTLAALAVFAGCFSDFRQYAVPGERLVISVLAADRHQAKVILGYVRAMLTTIPMLKKMLVREVADSFELSTGLTIEITTASFRTARGFTAPLILCDEIAFWMNTETSANPDQEILRGLRPALSTIPNSMLLAASSPYAKKGSLWNAYRRHYGQDGDVLIWKAPSKLMNPSLPQSVLDDAFADDPASAASEYGADFRSDIASFVDRQTVECCIDRGAFERPFQPNRKYAAFCDPSGGSSDSFTLAIAHVENADVIVIDCLREIPAPFSPPAAVAELAGVLKSYKLRRVTGDRYAGEWVATAFRQVGITYENSQLTRSECYLEFLPLLNSGKVKLLDHAKAVNQICGLERRTARSGKDSIDHSPGAHDDLANSLAGAATLVTGATQPSCGSMPLDDFFSMLNSDNWRVDADGVRKYAPPRVWTPWGT